MVRRLLVLKRVHVEVRWCIWELKLWGSIKVVEKVEVVSHFEQDRSLFGLVVHWPQDPGSVAQINDT